MNLNVNDLLAFTREACEHPPAILLTSFAHHYLP